MDGRPAVSDRFVLASWQPAVALAGWFLYFVRNMRRKDESMSRDPVFASYKHCTGMFFPALSAGEER
jgi:hypothetical protein